MHLVRHPASHFVFALCLIAAVFPSRLSAETFVVRGYGTANTSWQKFNVKKTITNENGDIKTVTTEVSNQIDPDGTKAAQMVLARNVMRLYSESSISANGSFQSKANPWSAFSKLTRIETNRIAPLYVELTASIDKDEMEGGHKLQKTSFTVESDAPFEPSDAAKLQAYYQSVFGKTGHELAKRIAEKYPDFKTVTFDFLWIDQALLGTSVPTKVVYSVKKTE